VKDFLRSDHRVLQKLNPYVGAAHFVFPSLPQRGQSLPVRRYVRNARHRIDLI